MGSQVILWVLLALPVLSISLIVERWLRFRKRRVDVHGLGKKLNELLRRGDLASAIAVCKEAAPSLEGEVMGEALELYPEGHDAVAEMVAGGLRERKPRLQAGLLFLGTLGNNAPFVGLFGTILGIITAFRELSNASQGSMGNVMSGIAEALIATAVGILVAIPAVVAFNVFQKRSEDVEENLAALSNYVFAHMKGGATARTNGSAVHSLEA